MTVHAVILCEFLLIATAAANVPFNATQFSYLSLLVFSLSGTDEIPLNKSNCASPTFTGVEQIVCDETGSVTHINFNSLSLVNQLPTLFAFLPDLIYFNVSNNSLVGVTTPLSQAVNLQTLDLSRNKLYGDVLTVVEGSLHKLNVCVLNDLTPNYFTNCFYGSDPKSDLVCNPTGLDPMPMCDGVYVPRFPNETTTTASPATNSTSTSTESTTTGVATTTPAPSTSTSPSISDTETTSSTEVNTAAPATTTTSQVTTSNATSPDTKTRGNFQTALTAPDQEVSGMDLSSSTRSNSRTILITVVVAVVFYLLVMALLVLAVRRMRARRRRAVAAEQGAAAAAAKRTRLTCDIDNVKTDSSGEVRSFMWENEAMILAHYKDDDNDYGGTSARPSAPSEYEMQQIPDTKKAALPPPIQRIDSHIYVPAGFGKQKPPTANSDIIDVESINSNSDTEFAVERSKGKARSSKSIVHDGYAPLPKGAGGGIIYTSVEPLREDAGLRPNINYDILVVDDPYRDDVSARKSKSKAGSSRGRPDFDAARRRRPPASAASKNRTNYIDCEQPFD